MADVAIRVTAEPEFEEATSEAKRAFGGMEADAKRAAEGIEEPFERAAAEVGSSFDRVDDDVRSSLGRLGGIADRAADGIEEPFEAAARGIGSDFDGLDRELKSEFDRAEAAAASAAGGIESEFESAGSRIPAAFGDVRNKLGSVFDKIEGDAGEAADGIGSELGGIAQGIDLGDVAGTISSQLGGLAAAGGPVAAIASAAGAIFGDEMADGFNSGFARRRTDVQDGIRTGLDSIDIGETGQAAGEAFAARFGESLTELRSDAAALRKEFEGFTLGTGEAEILKQVDLLRTAFGVELPESVEIARRQVANNMAPDITTALGNILATAQELPATFEEALDVQKEYAATFGPLNVSGAQLAAWLGDVARSGAFENIDKGADAIRELNTSLNETERVRPFVEELGLDIERLQDAINDGRGAEAFNAVFDAIVQLEDPTRQNVISAELFGSALEDVGDKAAALQALRFDETWEDTAAAIRDATEATEESASSFDLAKREVTGFFDGVGSAANRVLGDTDMVWQSINDGIDSVLGPTETLDKTFGQLEKKTGDVAIGVELASGAMEFAADAARDAGVGMDEFALSTDGAGDSLSGLVDELDSLLNFSADQLMRSIADASDDLAASLEETDNSLIGLNGAIEVGTEEGRQLQAAFEDLASEQANAARELADGTITQGEYAAASAEVRAELDRVTGAADLTTAQIQGLIEKYGIVPPKVETDVIANDLATATLDGIGKALNRIPKTRTVTVTTRSVNSGFRGFAEGGTADGPALVGEEGFEIARRGSKIGLVGVGGPEIRDFDGPTEIVPHGESKRILAAKLPAFAEGTTGFRSQLPAIAAEIGSGTDRAAPVTKDDMRDLLAELADMDRGPAVNIEQWVVADGRDSFQDLRNLESVYRMASV